MHVLALRIELRFPQSRSLKQKRSGVRPIVDGLRARFDVSVSEVDHADTWQLATVGVALVGGKVSVVEALAGKIEQFVWATDAEVVGISRQWMDSDW